MSNFQKQLNQEFIENQKQAESFSKHLKSAGTGENEEECYKLIQSRYQAVNQDLAEVQEELDQQAGLKLRPQKAKFPAERARQIANSLEDTTVPMETIQRRVKSAVSNIANSFCDDYIQENAKFRNNAGLKCYITRTTTGKCCTWCTQIAGRYEYGRHPADIFRRHDNCDCTVTYEEGKKRQNVWTKKTWSAPNIPDEVLNFKPTVFTPEQAGAIERQNLQYKGLTIPGKTGTIELRDANSRYKPVTNEAINNMPDLSLFTSNRMNQAYRQANQDLLREVAKHSNLPVGTEFSIVYDANMKRIPGFDYVPGRVGSVKVQNPGEPFHAFHNHASGESFSYVDLLNFTRCKEMLSFTATGNAGNVYNVSKNVSSDVDGYKEFLIQKTKEIIYQTKDLSSEQKIEISYHSITKEIYAKLSQDQKEELEQALINWSLSCAEGGENYGIKYTTQKT